MTDNNGYLKVKIAQIDAEIKATGQRVKTLKERRKAYAAQMSRPGDSDPGTQPDPQSDPED